MMVADKPNQDPLSKLYAEWVSVAVKMSLAGLDATLKFADAAAKVAVASRSNSKTVDTVQTNPTVPATEPTTNEFEKTAADDLKKITGVGPKLVQMLARNGITSFSQLALLDDAAIDRLDNDLNLNGRIRRDDWVGQATKYAQNTGAQTWQK